MKQRKYLLVWFSILKAWGNQSRGFDILAFQAKGGLLLDFVGDPVFSIVCMYLMGLGT